MHILAEEADPIASAEGKRSAWWRWQQPLAKRWRRLMRRDVGADPRVAAADLHDRGILEVADMWQARRRD